MSKRLVRAFFWSAAGVIPCAAGDSTLVLPVKLFNEARLSSAELARAKEQAAWALSTVSIELSWIDCPLPDRRRPMPCGLPGGLELHILDAPPTTASIGAAALGFAIPFQGHAAAFLSRIRVTAATDQVIDPSALLGDVLAHELTHLLLRSTAHSAEGIMRKDFRPADLKKASHRQLLFTASQRAAIRQSVAARVGDTRVAGAQ